MKFVFNNNKSNNFVFSLKRILRIFKQKGKKISRNKAKLALFYTFLYLNEENLKIIKSCLQLFAQKTIKKQ